MEKYEELCGMNGWLKLKIIPALLKSFRATYDLLYVKTHMLLKVERPTNNVVPSYTVNNCILF